MACWIVLLMPQLIEQWRLKSAEGIAIGFISIWFLGDVFNLAGAMLAHLLPEVVFLAVWFCFADFLMIFSYVYYTYIYKKHHPHHDRSRSSASLSPNNSHRHPHHHHQLEHDADENEALLARRRRSSTITNIALEPANHSVWTRYVLPIFFVVAAGAMGYFISTPSASPPDGELPSPIEDGGINVFAQVLGYLSAALYLGARIPQIVQNYQRKSVYGLSLLFFLFLTLGNLTYAGQILFYRSDSKYILLNLSWILGSLGTIFEDCIIFAQFYMYGDNEGKETTDHEAVVG